MSDQLGRDLYLTAHGTRNRKISVPLAGFEPAIPAIKRPQTHALDRAGSVHDCVCVCVCVCLYIYIYLYIYSQTSVHERLGS